jgi:hypothetical protein
VGRFAEVAAHAAMFRPRPGVLRGRLVGRSDDCRYYPGRLGDRSPGRTDRRRRPNVIAPFGLDLRLVDGYLPSYVSGLFNLLFGPFLSYNLTFVTGAVQNAELSRMAHDAYGTFRHPAVAPLAQLAPGTFMLELFHGPTLAFKDLAMQFLSRLMDHALVQRGERSTIVVATSGDTGGAAVEAFRGGAQVDRSRSIRTAASRRAAVHYPPSRTCTRSRSRNLRRLSGDREGHVQPPLSATVCGFRRQLDQLRPHRRGRLLLRPRPRSARRIARWRSRCRPETSATCSPATWRSAWGCRSSG